MSLNGEWFDKLEIIQIIKEKDGQDGQHVIQLDKDIDMMKKRLDRQQWYTKVAYTPHDFSHHVKTVITYGSKIIKPYADQFSMDDLLAFGYASLLHDIDMVYNPFGREIHSLSGDDIIAPFEKESNREALLYLADKINLDINDMRDIGTEDLSDEQKELIEEIHDKLSDVIEFLIPEQTYRSAIGKIILGHSDIKLGEKGKIPTLDATLYKNAPEGPNSFEKIKIRQLAAILRVADELDCTKRRKMGIGQPVLPSEAKKYWERLDLFSSVSFELPKIQLIVDDGFIKRESTKKDIHFERMQEVVNKINEEIDSANICFREENTTIRLDYAELVFSDDGVEKEYNQFIGEQKKN